MQTSYKNLIKMVSVLTIVAVISAYALSYVEKISKAPIQKAKDAKQMEAISSVIGEFDNDPFAEKMIISTPDKKDKLELYPARKDGVINSFAIKTFSNSGFGGRIELIVGFHIDGSIKGFKVIDHHETPGLGSKITETKFQKQFNGFNPHNQKLKVRQDGGDVDAVTAATITSRAVTEAIQKAVDAYFSFNAGETDD